MFRSLSALLAVCAFFAPLNALAAQPQAVIKLEPHRTRWALQAQVNGQTRKYLLDTAGGLTLISKAAAQAGGCQPWGQLTGHNMFGERLDTPRCEGVTFAIDGKPYAPPTTGLIDMEKLNPADAGVDGIVSLDLFEDRAITLDLAAGKLIVESPESLAERTRGMTALPTRLSREVQGRALSVFIAVPTAKGLIWLELDSGNGGTVLISKHAAPLVGLDPAAPGKQVLDFQLAPGVRLKTDSAFTPDMIMDGNIGMPFLRHWLVTLDLKAGKAWLAPNPADPPPA